MSRSGSRDEDNASFAPVSTELHETGPGVESPEAGTQEAPRGRHQRREPGEVSDEAQRPLAERIRESGGS